MTTIDSFPLELDGEVTVATEWSVTADGDPERGWVVQDATLETVAAYIDPKYAYPRNRDNPNDVPWVGVKLTPHFRRIMDTCEGRWQRLYDALNEQWERDQETAAELHAMSVARELGVD